jgi:hypothetical protein
MAIGLAREGAATWWPAASLQTIQALGRALNTGFSPIVTTTTILIAAVLLAWPGFRDPADASHHGWLT